MRSVQRTPIITSKPEVHINDKDIFKVHHHKGEPVLIFRETFAFYFKNRMKHMNTLCEYCRSISREGWMRLAKGWN
jgi:hypothetical protein